MKTTEHAIPTTPPLGATLTLPDETRAAALVIQGSGVHDRDGNMPAAGFQSTLYRRVARELAQRCGLATLRYDKRGHDKPRFHPHDYSIPQRLADAACALKVLRRELPGLPLYLLGHSEGALVAAKLAENEPVTGVVHLAAPFGNVFELGKARAARRAALPGGKSKGEQATRYYAQLEQLFKEGVKLLPEDFVAMARPFADAGYDGWESFEWLAGHWAGALASDPKVPMLVVQGGRDARLWPDNAQRWQKWCEARKQTTFKLIDHMGHDLNDARQKAFKVDDEVLDTICQWVKGA